MNEGVMPLQDLIRLLFHPLSRSVVQAQLVVVVAVWVGGWVLARWGWQQERGVLLHHVLARLGKGRWGVARRSYRVVKHMTYPTLVVLGFYLELSVIRASGRFFGLVENFLEIAWLFWAYRLVMALLYANFPDRGVARYHRRLLTPLFVTVIALELLRPIITLERLFALPLVNLFGTPLTFGALFAATIGLYLWITGTVAVQDVLRLLLRPRLRLSSGSLDAGLTLARYLIILLGIVFALQALGLPEGTIAFVSGGLSVGIGFGLQSVVGNFVSGVILLFEQSIRPGDLVELDGQRVLVQRTNFRSTEVKTFSGAEIIIPNEKLLTSNVVTFTKTDRKVRLDVDVSIGYDSNLRDAIALLLKIARRNRQVLHDPAPLVIVMGFGESGIDLSLKAWVKDLNFLLRNELLVQVWDEFRKAGINIPYPQRDLHLKSGLEVLAEPSSLRPVALATTAPSTLWEPAATAKGPSSAGT